MRGSEGGICQSSLSQLCSRVFAAIFRQSPLFLSLLSGQTGNRIWSSPKREGLLPGSAQAVRIQYSYYAQNLFQTQSLPVNRFVPMCSQKSADVLTENGSVERWSSRGSDGHSCYGDGRTFYKYRFVSCDEAGGSETSGRAVPSRIRSVW